MKDLYFQNHPYRNNFNIPKMGDSDVIYFCGHSLGLKQKNSSSQINAELEAWEKLAVEAHHRSKNPWVSFHENLIHQSASIVGAKNKEVVVMNSLTVNLHLLLVSFYRPSKEKYKIIIEKNAFPSDIYALKSQIRFHGFDPDESIIEIEPNDNSYYISEEDIISCLQSNADQCCLLLMGGVNYLSGQAFNIRKITKLCSNLGIIAGFDLAHAVGNIELKLNEWKVDFACWCGYKYLNGGPGCPSGIFINEKYFKQKVNRFEGWWGTDKLSRFKMETDFMPIKSAEAWQISNPPIFSMAPLWTSLNMFHEIGMNRLRLYGLELSDYLYRSLKGIDSKSIKIISPDSKYERGCQISLLVKNCNNLREELLSNHIICDFREPGILRIAPVPMYNTIEDINFFISVLKKIIKK
jgi:kynureninase